MNFETYSSERVQKIDAYIEQSLKQYEQTISQRFMPLIEAMRYSLASGGKRLRPLLMIASAECLGLKPEHVFPAACAIEYIHTYSLIHDDLPALDDDEVRRGKPSSHVQFGEAIAILAGDALLTESFNQMLQLSTSGDFSAAGILSATELLIHNSGIRGMVGGQLLDVTLDTSQATLPEIEFIHIHKTGAMILASVLIPTRLMPCSEMIRQKLKRYGEAIGLAFQISDDLLDSEASVRYSRGPSKKPKPNYVQLMSPVETREKLNGLINTAIQSIESEGEVARPLIEIAEFIRTRRT